MIRHDYFVVRGSAPLHAGARLKIVGRHTTSAAADAERAWQQASDPAGRHYHVEPYPAGSGHMLFGALHG